MKILLANPPWIVGERYGVRAGSRWPFTLELEENTLRHYLPFPFFLAYSTSLLKKYYQDVSIIDAVAVGLDEVSFLNKIESLLPDLIVLETSTPSFGEDILIAKKIKETVGNIRIAFGGAYASVFCSHILQNYGFIDYILIGEYEYTLLDLVNHLTQGLGLEGILGLAYREDGQIKVNKRRPTIKNLDSLPWPERDSLPLYSYNDGFCGLPLPNVQMLASRGCPFGCIFCLWPQVIYGEHLYRKREPRKVIDEMEWLINNYDFKAIYFDDDTFNVDNDYVKDICKEMRRRKIDTPWAVMARPDLMDVNLLEQMVSSGLYAIKYGVESGVQKILDNCKKNMDLNKVKKIIRLTKDLGIKVHLTFCFGLPGESKDTIESSLDFLLRTDPDSVQFSIATPFPGTEFFRYIEQEGYLVSKDWSQYDGNYKAVIRTDQLAPQDLEKAIKEAYRVWESFKKHGVTKR
jgi:radical SAM superfamily enzyme YgiQ (UPF0313 family)